MLLLLFCQFTIHRGAQSVGQHVAVVVVVDLVIIIIMMVTWHIIRIASIEQQMPVSVITEGRKDAGYGHTGATIAPQVT